MYELLIVDDEEATLQGLASLHWEQLQISRVHCATSVKKAFDIVSACSIDVIVTDIRMPGRSGIDLIQEMNERQWEQQPKCILLSGYSEFNYAQAAIKARAIDYLLKPVHDKDLIKAVQRALLERMKEKKEQYVQEKSVETIKMHLTHISESIFQPWLTGDKSDEALKIELQHYEINNREDVRAIPITVFQDHQKQDEDQLHKRIQQELTSSYILLQHDPSNMYVLYPIHDWEPLEFEVNVHRDISSLRKALKKEFYQGVTIIIGEPVLFWKQAKRMLTRNDNELIEEVSHDERLAIKVKEYIHSSFLNQPTLQDVANELYLNPAYVSKRFKEETGETFTDYIHRLRMNRAVSLLADTNLKVSVISKELGYQNASYFIRVFKKEFNQTPHEFRKR
ncbi:response regulator [Alkalihalobacillus sp. LMS6]|uniref:response regulator n=1 Tax=Alkalihalobacillus sp. LMS6 TaxID=2924034 RepID=UPI0020D1906A|nr:response regulator [Alkalihalobacillus sp. LMS6]UTR05802.1 response regulator [Alkalihalobacillus sp. LMS6]